MERKSSPRLKYFDYKGSYCYFITCCTYRNNRYFVNKNTVDLVYKVLLEIAAKHSFVLAAYCFMPDHLHIVLSGDKNSLLRDFMRVFKQKSAYYFKSYFEDKLWQRSFYDHILRKEEALKDVCLYIFGNPVRKGLVADFRDYPYLGSEIFDIRQLL